MCVMIRNLMFLYLAMNISTMISKNYGIWIQHLKALSMFWLILWITAELFWSLPSPQTQKESSTGNRPLFALSSTSPWEYPSQSNFPSFPSAFWHWWFWAKTASSQSNTTTVLYWWSSKPPSVPNWQCHPSCCLLRPCRSQILLSIRSQEMRRTVDDPCCKVSTWSAKIEAQRAPGSALSSWYRALLRQLKCKNTTNWQDSTALSDWTPEWLCWLQCSKPSG